jgi:TolA-binding protein
MPFCIAPPRLRGALLAAAAAALFGHGGLSLASLPDGLKAKTVVIDHPLTLEDLAREHHPGPLRQQRFMRWVVEANPEHFREASDLPGQPLAPGLRLLIPDGVPPRRPGDHQTAVLPALQRQAAPAAATEQVDRLDHLLVSQMGAQASQDQRLAELEAGVTELQSSLHRLVRHDEQQRNQQLEDQQARVPNLSSGGPDWPEMAAATLAGASLSAGLLVAHHRRRRPTPTEKPLGDQTQTLVNEDRPLRALRPVVPMDLPLEIPEIAATYRSLAGTPSLFPTVEPVDEARAAIELVDIMSSMGLTTSAAQALVDHIRAKPRQSLHHWLKLFELHRQNGDQEGFEQAAQELREHFNVQPATWRETSPTAGGCSLEAYPHLRSRLIRCWQGADCVRFLQSLLLDNREGTRGGFPLAVAEEILLLIAIKEATSS